MKKHVSFPLIRGRKSAPVQKNGGGTGLHEERGVLSPKAKSTVVSPRWNTQDAGKGDIVPVLKWLYENEGYKGYGEVSRAWKCPLCGDVQQGDDPLMECPYCLAPRDAFRELGKKRRVSAHQNPPRSLARFARPGRRTLFDKYMTQEASEWIRSIRS
ncbi:MAG: hypothetical protein WDA72_09795 [Desulfomonilia bacterium]|jgi:rubredoxin|nr:hypothetical protein [Deltaproteobacteria bacterium]MDX9760826.1 hypothetical protein [Desulfomonilia bacterium]HPW70171.1 hypothetical protein [Deltaproteobacteria bacterium]